MLLMALNLPPALCPFVAVEPGALLVGKLLVLDVGPFQR